jgi:threonine/homoserine/homoserine lactone efflux protein
MSLDLYAAYVLACIVIVLVPGPTVTLIIANGLRHGARAGLLNVAGTQLGLAVIITVVGIGLSTVVEAMGHWFDWIRLAGAAYLIWLGWRLFRGGGGKDATSAPAKPRGGFLVQGFVVALSNPKTLLFFGAFFPQFIDPAGNYALQIVVMGLTALACAAVSDATYAVASARAARAFTQKRVRLLSRISGGFLIGGGLWLALSRSR